MSHFENRNKIIDRIEKELIGPGSDIFLCDADFSNEIIEGKPLQRYFSAILFPKQIVTDDSETGKDDFSQNDDEGSDIDKNIITPAEETEKEKSESDDDSDDEPDTVPKSNSNAFYPSHFGFSFSVSKSCSELNLAVSFGNYKKAEYDEILLPYSGSNLNLLSQFGLDEYAIFDEATKALKQAFKLKRIENKIKTEEYKRHLSLQGELKLVVAGYINQCIK